MNIGIPNLYSSLMSLSLAHAALVWTVDCPVGSVRGYDELYPHKIDLVKESKLYKIMGGR